MFVEKEVITHSFDLELFSGISKCHMKEIPRWKNLVELKRY